MYIITKYSCIQLGRNARYVRGTQQVQTPERTKDVAVHNAELAKFFGSKNSNEMDSKIKILF